MSITDTISLNWNNRFFFSRCLLVAEPAYYSRFLEESSQAAAHQQEELLGEEDPGDLLQRGLGLTPQVQDGGSQEGDAKAEAEERAPVRESLLQVALQQRPDPLVHQQQHVGPSEEVRLQGLI